MKQVPFRQKPEDGNTCSLFTLANVFNDDNYLKYKLDIIRKYGMPLKEENDIFLLCYYFNKKTSVNYSFIIEDCCKDLRGIRDEDIKYYLEDEVEEGKYNLYLLSTCCVQEFVDRKFHRCFVFTDGKTYFYVNSLNHYIHSYTLDEFLSHLGSIEIISISTFFEDRKPKSFTREELQHLLD